MADEIAKLLSALSDAAYLALRLRAISSPGSEVYRVANAQWLALGPMQSRLEDAQAADAKDPALDFSNEVLGGPGELQ